MGYTVKITEQRENAETGMAVAHLDIFDDANPTEVRASMIVHDKIADIEARIQEDVLKATNQMKAEVVTVPPKTEYIIDDDGNIT